MPARLLRARKPESSHPRNAARLACELLEDRTAPAIWSFNVNVPDDTKFARGSATPRKTP
jgi:hypothetical protein